MKYIKIVTNWLFLVLGFQLFYLFLVIIIIGKTLKDIGHKIKEEHDDLVGHIFSQTFLIQRKPWLIKGENWPLQLATKEQKQEIRQELNKIYIANRPSRLGNQSVRSRPDNHPSNEG